MALQIWMPLNGDINNQGTSTPIITNSGATSNSSGKIGSCYYFNGSSHIKITKPDVFTTLQGITICAWVKSTSSTLALGGISHDSGTSLACCTLYTSGWQFTNNSTYKYVSAGSIANTSVWKHAAITIDTSGNIKTYLDGSLITSTTISSIGALYTLNSNNFIEIGCDHPGGDEYLTGYVNDFRVYDNALSPKEIKDLSRGLVLHYSLCDKYIEATTNYTPIPTTYGSTTSVSWDTSLNGTTMYYPSGWTSGYNGGVSNPTTGYHAHWVWDEGNLIMLFPNKNSVISQQGRWLGISRSLSCTGSIIPAGTKYTISWDQKTDTVGSYTTGGIYYYLTSSATSCNFHDGCPQIGKNTVAGVWQHFSYTFTRISSFDSNTKGQSIYVYGMYGTEANIWVKNVQLEVKDHDTGYVNSNDSTASRTTQLEYDTSGLSNNGTVMSGLTLATDSPRNNICYYFNGSSTSYIMGKVIDGAKPTTTISVSAWFKTTSTNTQAIVECFESGGVGMYVEGSNIGFQIYSGGYYNTSTPISTNTWYHAVGVYDGSAIKIYLNGVLKNSTSKTGEITYNASTPWAVGCNPGGTSYGGEPFYGYISDVRVYATALSVSDIQELYNAPISVTNNGTIMTQGEVVEE